MFTKQTFLEKKLPWIDPRENKNGLKDKNLHKPLYFLERHTAGL